MKYSRLVPALFLSAMFLLAACSKRDAKPTEAGADTPHGAVTVAVGALRSGDVLTFLKNAMTEAEYADAREEWETARAQPLDSKEEAELNETLARLRQEDAVDVIMDEIEPRLKEVKTQLPLMLGLAQAAGHAAIANQEDFTDEQKTAANELLGAMGRWSGGRDLADPDLARQAVTVAVEAGRSLELESASDLQALEFEEMVGRVGTMLTASKGMLRVYGIDIDAMLDSVTAETLSQEGDRAEVRIRFRFLDTDQKTDVPMIRRDGRWYSEDAYNHDHEETEEAVSEEAA